ncbi:hypothetical protein GCM10009097_39830 [Pigmentiphaga daeguensis]|uniref:Uncharacterized protein n=1 Tax=Pigmentiphaga daeguensis TaxID=414049 RepID=A0ABN1CG64_9BURK
MTWIPAVSVTRIPARRLANREALRFPLSVLGTFEPAGIRAGIRGRIPFPCAPAPEDAAGRGTVGSMRRVARGVATRDGMLTVAGAAQVRSRRGPPVSRLTVKHRLGGYSSTAWWRKSGNGAGMLSGRRVAGGDQAV